MNRHGATNRWQLFIFALISAVSPDVLAGDALTDAERLAVGSHAVIKSHCAVTQGPDKGRELADGMIVVFSRLEADRAWISGTACGWVAATNLASVESARAAWSERYMAPNVSAKEIADLALYQVMLKDPNAAKESISRVESVRDESLYVQVVAAIVTANITGIESVRDELFRLCEANALSSYEASLLFKMLRDDGDWNLGQTMLNSIQPRTRESSGDLLISGAQCAFANGDSREALRLIQLAVEKDPYFVEARSTLAWFLSQEGKQDEAIEELRKCVEMLPNGPKLHRHLGVCLFDSGRHEEGMNEVRESLELAPDDARTSYILGKQMLVVESVDFKPADSAELAEAIQHLTKACMLSDYKNVEYVRILCLAHAMQGNKLAALSIINSCLEKLPGDAPERDHLGETLNLVQELFDRSSTAK